MCAADPWAHAGSVVAVVCVCVGVRLTKTETRDAYVTRLRRTAMNLSPDYINRIIGTMAKRVRLPGAAKGGHFREGGS